MTAPPIPVDGALWCTIGPWDIGVHHLPTGVFRVEVLRGGRLVDDMSSSHPDEDTARALARGFARMAQAERAGLPLHP